MAQWYGVMAYQLLDSRRAAQGDGKRGHDIHKLRQHPKLRSRLATPVPLQFMAIHIDRSTLIVAWEILAETTLIALADL